MESNSSEDIQQLTITASTADTEPVEANKSIEESGSTQSGSSVAKPEAKEKSKEASKWRKVVVGSRYMQSTQDWVNKRTTDDSHNSSQGGASRPPSRNPTPERKKAVPNKSSTPLSTDKSINFSGISVINKLNEIKDKNPTKTEIKKYAKPLMGRKSLAPNRHLFDSDSGSGRSGPLTVSGAESQTRNKDFEDSIKRSIYLQTVFLNLKAEQSRKDRKTDAFNKITAVWKQTNEMRDKLTETHKYVHSLEEKIEGIAVLENQKNHLEKYSDIRSKVDPLFNQLAELIDNQKRLFKIENCSEEDFHKINELLENCPNSERLESAANATTGLKTAEQLAEDIKTMEIGLKELHQSFDRCVKELDKYESIENKVFPEKSLSLKKLF